MELLDRYVNAVGCGRDRAADAVLPGSELLCKVFNSGPSITG